MPWIAVLVFLAVFAVAILAMMLLGGGGQRRKQVLERLDAVTLAVKRQPGEETLNILRQDLLGSIPWMDQWLREIDLFLRLRRILAQTELQWAISKFAMLSLTCATAAGIVVYLRTGAWPFAAALAALAATGPFLYVLYKRAQRFASFEEKLPEALDMMVGAIRAGHSLMSSLEMVAKEMPNPISGEFRKCFDEQNFGLELREAMLNLAQRVPIHDIHIIVTAILIQKESGGNLAEILEKAAHVIRERFRLKRQIRVHTAQGRLTGWILALLPIVLAIGIYLVKPEHMSTLWRHPTGLKMMYTAAGMTVLGGLIIRKIVRVRV